MSRLSEPLWQVERRDEKLAADLRREFEQLSKHVGSRFFRSGFAQRQVKRERPGCCWAESVGSVEVGGFFVQCVGQQHAHSQFCSQAQTAGHGVSPKQFDDGIGQAARTGRKVFNPHIAESSVPLPGPLSRCKRERNDVSENVTMPLGHVNPSM